MKTSQAARFSSFTPKSKFSLPKEERLKSSQKIAAVFAQSLSINSYPLLVFYCAQPAVSEQPPIKAAFTVSKKKFKRAVDRNKIKRLMREAYRHHKYQFYQQQKENQLHLVFVYTGKEIEQYELVEKKMKKLISKLVQV